jgi:hypothetical protein
MLAAAPTGATATGATATGSTTTTAAATSASPAPTTRAAHRLAGLGIYGADAWDELDSLGASGPRK